MLYEKIINFNLENSREMDSLFYLHPKYINIII